MMIARTELVTAYNEGAYGATLDAQVQGYIGDCKKTWLTAADERVCRICAPLDGVSVNMGAFFPGGVKLPPAHPNCRCGVAFVEVAEPVAPAPGLTNGADSGIMDVGDGNDMDENISGAASGALDENSDRAKEHAQQYYEAVRQMNNDYIRIAENTGFAESDMLNIKNYLFVDRHDLMDGRMRFDPDYQIAQSWQRLIDGKNIQPHDLTLLRHEMVEMSLVNGGMTQSQAHTLATRQHNYTAEVIEWRRNNGLR